MIKKVNWIGACTNCGGEIHDVDTNSKLNDRLFDGDSVTCCGCGNEGVVECDSVEGARVAWDSDWED